MPSVAVVILTYNSRAFLPECLAATEQLSVPAEVIVADNASSDGTADLLRAHYPTVRLLELGRNWGFAEGYNRALATVTAEWVVLLNPDARLAPDWLAVLLAAAADHPRAAILGGKLLFADTTAGPVIQCAGVRLTDAGTAFEVGWGEPDHGQYDQAGVTASIPGAALLLRRATFQALGGFDAGYFTYLEDVDLCWRAWLTGAEVWYIPAAVAFHHFGGAAGGRASAFRIYWMQRNRYANMLKHLEARTWLSGAVTAAAYDLYRVLEFAAHRQWAALRALLGGTGAFLGALPALWRERRRLQQTRQVRDHELRSRGLLVPALAAFHEYRRLAALARSRDP